MRRVCILPLFLLLLFAGGSPAQEGSVSRARDDPGGSYGIPEGILRQQPLKHHSLGEQRLEASQLELAADGSLELTERISGRRFKLDLERLDGLDSRQREGLRLLLHPGINERSEIYVPGAAAYEELLRNLNRPEQPAPLCQAGIEVSIRRSMTDRQLCELVLINRGAQLLPSTGIAVELLDDQREVVLSVRLDELSELPSGGAARVPLTQLAPAQARRIRSANILTTLSGLPCRLN